MSFNATDINLDNYEEFFLLYVDKELDAEANKLVESFTLLHPHLAEELDLLLSAKLPADEVSFFGKEALHASSMETISGDEDLLLYIDNELAPGQEAAVEEKISNNKNYALQYAILKQTKLDSAELITHPNKEELFRRSQKVVYMPVWMRAAVAMIFLLFSSLYLLNNSKEPVPSAVVNAIPVNQPGKKNSGDETKKIAVREQQDRPFLVQAKKEKKYRSLTKIAPGADDPEMNSAHTLNKNAIPAEKDLVKIDIARPDLSIIDIPVNNTIAHTAVTSPLTASYNNQNNPAELAATDGEFETEKKGRAKSFVRKVSRFIQRNTGIGTVNTDNELLVGVVALKLK